MTALSEKILSDLLTYSSFQSPLSSAYFEGKYGVRGVTVRKAINEIIESDNAPIVASDFQGYYTPSTIEESEVGLKQIRARINSLQDRLKRMENKHNTKFSKDPIVKNKTVFIAGVDPAYGISTAFAERLAEGIEAMMNRSGGEV